MPTIETKQCLTDLRTEILSDATVSGLVGTRLYAIQAAQNATMPYVVYNVITSNPTLTMDGDASQTRMPLQFDVYGETQSSALTVSAAISDKLTGLSATQGSTNIQASIPQGERTYFEDEPEYSRVSLDYLFTFST